MSKVLKFIVHFVVICTILCVAALAVPPFFGVTTQIQDDAGAITNLPMGSVVYAIPQKADQIQNGDPILVTDNGAVYRLNMASLDMSSGRGQVVDPAVANAAPVNVAFGEYLPKIVLQIPFIGYLLKATQSLEGLVVIGLVVLFLIILYVIAELWKPKAGEEEEDGYLMQDSEPGYVKTKGELRAEEKSRKRAMRREEEMVRQEERYRKKKNGGKIRTGGFVDEVDESDFDEDGYFDDEDEDSMYSATTEAHEVLRRGVKAVTQDELMDEEDAEPVRRTVQRQAPAQQGARRSARPAHQAAPRRRPAVEAAPSEPQEPEKKEYKKLAIPRYSAEQMAKKARLEGDDPDVVTDDVTGITQFDYSDLLFDDMEAPLDDGDDF